MAQMTQRKTKVSYQKLKSGDDSGSRLERLKRVDTPRTLKVKEQAKKAPYLPGLDKIPQHLRFGPWSPASYIYLVVVVCGLIYYFSDAMATFPSDFKPTSSEIVTQSLTSGIWRLCIGIWGIVILVIMVMNAGWWPLASFTMMSWCLFTSRHFLLAIYYLGHNGQYFGYCNVDEANDICDKSLFLSELLRYPSIACNSITVSVWWGILFPSIYYFLATKSSQSALKAFVEFNRSFVLINVHLLNLPFAVMDHVLQPRKLEFGDTYAAVVVAIVYMLVYLFIMDPIGMHFYHIILSPRPHWCFVPYTGILLLFPGFMYLWNIIAWGQ